MVLGQPAIAQQYGGGVQARGRPHHIGWCSRCRRWAASLVILSGGLRQVDRSGRQHQRGVSASSHRLICRERHGRGGEQGGRPGLH